MRKHLCYIYLAFKEICGLKLLFLDTIFLWWKSCNLYFSFLAFTDPERPNRQLYAAMICALLSAVYDYETDWEHPVIFRETRFFLTMLEKYCQQGEKNIAIALFFKDRADNLSKRGLERGAYALVFYNSMIRSGWMKKYARSDIENFGEMLQIIDDLFDFKRDAVSRDKNCFLVGQSIKEELVFKAKEFLGSEFFQELVKNSWLYGFFRWKSRRLLKSEIEISVFKQLLRTMRPITGLFAFVLTIIGFRFHHRGFSGLSIFTAFAFSGITSSIMVFNDIMDRDRDLKKGKFFASKNFKKLLFFWISINFLTACILAMNPLKQMMAFCFLVWLIGLTYSLFIRRFFLIQNLTVAFCSASPILCGNLCFAFKVENIFTFWVIFSLVFLREIYKDIEDETADLGSKNTISVLLGVGHARMFALLLPFFASLPFVLYKNPLLRLVCFGFPILEFLHAYCFLYRRKISPCKNFLDWMIKSFLIGLFIF